MVFNIEFDTGIFKRKAERDIINRYLLGVITKGVAVKELNWSTGAFDNFLGLVFSLSNIKSLVIEDDEKKE